LATLGQTLIGLSTAIGLLIYQWDTAYGQSFGGAIVFDGLTLWAGLVTLIITAVSLIYIHSHSVTEGSQFAEHVFLLLNACVGMLVLLSSNDLIITFIGIELMSLSL